MPGDPNWNPDADLDGDDEVSLFDFGILTSHFGEIGADEFAGTAQAASGAFTATLRVELGDWSGQTERGVYVVLQFKRAGTEDDLSTPIYEQVVSFAQNETVKEVQVRLPAGIYTLRALAYNDAQRTDISHWLRSELSSVVVPQGGGNARNIAPPPGWAEEVVPTDSVLSGGMGPSSASRVNLASGAYEHVPPADIEVSNPYGPPVSFARRYSSQVAQAGVSSPGLGIGWKHSLDLVLFWDRINNATSATLYYPNGSTESLGVTQQGSVYRLTPPEGAPYAGLAEPDVGYPGGWRITLFFRDYSRLVFAPVTAQSLNTFRLVGMVDRAGNGVGLYYQGDLLRYVKAGNANLLELVYDGNGLLTQAKAYEAGTGNVFATVTYLHQQLDDGNRHLVQVSQINAPTTLRWGFEYGYIWTRQNGTRVRLLSEVQAPDPRGGSGVLRVPIAYDSNGMVQMLVDANGHAHRYVYGDTGTTDVEIYNGSTGTRDFGWTQKLGVAGVNGGVVDAQGNQSQVVYSSTYLPALYTNRNGQTTQATYDLYGNLTQLVSPRNIRTVVNCTYPADYPISPVQQIEVLEIGANGTTKTSTIYTFYTPHEEEQQVPGAKAGLLKEWLCPRPGVPGERVSTRYYYNTQGNLVIAEAPGANDEGRQRTTVYFYNRDPFTGENFVPLLGRPVAEAVYDETIANVWSEYQYWLQNRNDGFWTQSPRRLIFFQRYRYDWSGRLIAVIDAEGNATTFTYNAANQIATVKYPPLKGKTNPPSGVDPGFDIYTEEQYVYWPSAGGQLHQILVFANNAFVRSVSVGAGPEGEPTSTTGATQPVQVSYDALYRPTGIADGKNNITTFGYNEVGFPNMTTYPLGDTFRWYYAPVNQQTAWWGTDKEDNPVARVDANGILTRFVRSTDDSRLLRMEYYNNPADPNSLITTQTVYVDYDEFNRVRQLQNGEAQLEYTYDDNNLPLTVTTTYPAPVGSKTILYQYYPDGSRKSMTVPGVGTFSYIYEYTTGSSPMRVSGLRVRVVCPWTPHPNIDCNYDQAGRLRRETNGGVRTDYDYYPRGLLSRQVSFYGPGTLASAFAQFDMGYQPSLPGIFYDALGNRTGMYVTVPPYGSALGIVGRVDYLYDARDRLIRETFTLANNIFWYDDAYSYDDADNATAIHGQVFTHNANNQVTDAGFRYDGNGNATLFRTLALGFDVENRIVQLPDLYRRGNNVIAAGYRPDGMQAWRQDAGGRVYFLYDGGRLVAEYSAANGSLLQYFAYSAEGLNQRRGNQHRLFTFDPDGNLVHRLTAGSVSPLSITWHNRTGVVYQDQLASTGALVDVPNAGTVGYQGYWGVYSDASTRTMEQGRFAALVTLNAGGYFDPLTAHGMRRDFATLNPYARLYRPERSLANRVTNLVISWADAGWTAGDPAAAPGAALAKAVSALRRTVDAAWEIPAIASLPRALGALGVGILNAADDLAGSGAALTRGARQASRELKPVVIGENMDRVRAYARMRGAMTISDWIPSPQRTFEKNMQWVRQIIAEGREVIDIGSDFLRRASTGRASGVYEMERRLLKGYPNYVRDFQRWHRLQGGNPYVDPWVHFLRTAGQP